jgi:probable rRNA maturation factor
LKPTITVRLSNQQKRHPILRRRLCEAVQAVLLGERIREANVSIVVVNDRTIHRLNHRFLNHDEPTDVITFSLEEGDFIDGEIVTSADTAAAAARRFGWTMADELLLYTVHGALHLAGYDDRAPAERRTMRSRERRYLAKFGLKPQYDTEAMAASLKSHR